MTNIQKVHFFILLSIFYFLFSLPFLTLAQVQPREAVRLYVNSTATQIAPDSEIIVSLRIDSAKPVNAFDMVLLYPEALLKPVLFNDSASMVDVWRTRQWDGGNGFIRLSGGMLKPFSGTGGTIAEFRFKALHEGIAQISFGNTNVYYADGTGTRADIATELVKITITKSVSLLNTPQKDDTVPPVFRSLQTAKNPVDGNYLAVFEVKDAGSGVKSVNLRTMEWFTFSEWRPVSSPVELPKGTWQYQISAVDNNGNTSMKTLHIPMEIAKKLFITVLLFFIFGIVCVIIKKWFLIKK